MSEAREKLLSAIMDAIQPKKMSPEEALELLETLAADIEGIIEGIKEDMLNAD